MNEKYFRITYDSLKQFLAFKIGLNTTQMVGWAKTDKSKVQTCQYWHQSYLNGLEMIYKQ